jgi:hypothetical protein
MALDHRRSFARFLEIPTDVPRNFFRMVPQHSPEMI